MTGSGRYYVVAITVLMSAITYLHYSTEPFIQHLHELLRELYYIPVFLSALVFGLKGALIVYLFLVIVYVPYIAMSWTGELAADMNAILHLLLQGAFGFFAGYMVDRDRNNREQIEKQQYLSGVGRAASAIVHDLKNPLIAILAFGRRLLEGKTEVDSAARAIIHSAENMERITHDVLDFARPFTLELSEGDIWRSISAACDQCRTLAESAGVVLNEHLPHDPVMCMIDGNRLERALVNLLKNAVEASPRDGNVLVSAEAEEDRVLIRIKDDGPGMDRETFKNMFVPFFTRKSSGTGLGMSIAKKIIEAHHGSINIKSRPGSGTEITLTLPRKV